MLSFLSSTLPLFALPLLVNAVNFPIKVSTKNVSPDGFTREAITVNGQFPSPLIKLTKNDLLQANVTNQLSSPAIEKSVSIHWHGFFQHRTSAQDGVSSVTQCPISPGLSYKYSFSTAGQTGTYWYHSHHRTQYCDGLRGPIVVYDRADPQRNLYDIDDENTVVTLADWYHIPAIAAFADPTIINPFWDSILINGKGRYVGGPQSPLSVINVVKGVRYRFRLVNIACFANFNVTIDGHQFDVIEADGIAHQPKRVNQLTIYPGQRYSIVVKADQSIGNYWFRADPQPANVPPGQAPPPPPSDPTINTAIFRYLGAPKTNPTTTRSPVNHLNQADLIPLEDAGSLGSGPADVTLTLNPGLDLTTGRWSLNNASFEPPSVPVLLQILSGASTPQQLLPPGSVYTLPKDSIIDVIIPDPFADQATAHPFHLHGHSFDVISSFGSPDNYVNPPRRDVAPVGGGGIHIRFKTDNSGPWIFHCHIDWHLNSGLAVVFAEDPAGIRSGPESVIIPPGYDNLCKAYDALPPSDQ